MFFTFCLKICVYQVILQSIKDGHIDALYKKGQKGCPKASKRAIYGKNQVCQMRIRVNS